MNFTLETRTKAGCDCKTLIPLTESWTQPHPTPICQCNPVAPSPRPAIIPNEMECLIRKMFCIALNFIFTFARALQLVEGCHLGLLATLFYFIFPIYIYFSDLYAAQRQKQCVPKRFTVHFVFCVFSPPFLLFSALHFIFSGWLTEWQTSQLNVHQLPPLLRHCCNPPGVQKWIDMLEKPSKSNETTKLRIAFGNGTSVKREGGGGGEGVEGKGLHWFL